MKREYLKKADKAKGCDWCGDEKNEPIRGFQGIKNTVTGHFRHIYFHRSCAREYLLVTKT